MKEEEEKEKEKKKEPAKQPTKQATEKREKEKESKEKGREEIIRVVWVQFLSWIPFNKGVRVAGSFSGSSINENHLQSRPSDETPVLRHNC